MTSSLFNRHLLYFASVVGLTSALAVHPASAQGVTDIVRGLNAVINPTEAQRFEDQARRSNRPAEERYWRDYRTGLETPDRSRDTGAGRGYGDRRFDPGDPRAFRSDAAINLELGRLSRDEQRRYRDGVISDRTLGARCVRHWRLWRRRGCRCGWRIINLVADLHIPA